jgi:DNA invertase Pin-like site-specific DNA recombinase
VAETAQNKPLKIRAFYGYIGVVTKEFLSDRGATVPQKRVAIYAQVSPVDRGQDPETQLLALGEYAARRGFVPMGEYVDYASGTQEDRPQYRALLETARKRQIDVVLVWWYDRSARSTQALVHALKEFHSLGVDFISFQENIDTTTPQGEMIFTVMASLAPFESALTSERVKAGMALAKPQGKRISRAPIVQQVRERIAALHAQGLSIQHIRKQLRIAYGKAWSYVQRLRATAGGRSSRLGHTFWRGRTAAFSQ